MASLLQRIPLYLNLALILGAGLAFVNLAGLTESRGTILLLLALLGLGGVVFTTLDSFGFLCVVLMFFPFTSGVFKFELGVITFSPYSAGLIILAAQSAVLLCTGAKAYALRRFDGWLIALCAIFLFSTLASDDLVNSGFLAFHALFLPTLAYVILRVLADDEEKYNACLGFFIAGAACFGAIYIAQSIYFQARVTLFNVAPVSAATLALPPALYLLYTGRSKRLLHKFAIAVCLACLFLSLSRIYILTLALSPLFMRAIRRGKARALLAWTMAASLALTMGLASLAPDVDIRTARDVSAAAGIDSTFRQEEGGIERLLNPEHWLKSTMLRAVVFRTTLKSIKEHPLMGVGTRRDDILVTSHNIHLEWLEYGGILGYIAYLSLLLSHFGQFQGRAVRDPEHAAHLLVVYIILVNSLTNGFMHGYFSNVAFTIFGFSHALAKIRPDAAPRFTELSESRA